MKLILTLMAAIVATMLSVTTMANPVVLYEDRVTPVPNYLPAPNDLWVGVNELQAVNGFELKPEGACLEDICVPVRQDRDGDLFVTRKGKNWFNVTGLARKLDQPYAVDHDANVWSLGQVPATRNHFVQQGIAPDFTLPDRNGKPVRLSEFKDMKVLLLTWASW
jgi:hypothetical protein